MMYEREMICLPRRRLALLVIAMLVSACQSQHDETVSAEPPAVVASPAPSSQVISDAQPEQSPTSPSAALPAPPPPPTLIYGTKPKRGSNAATSDLSQDNLADITINMVNADIATVVRAALGDALGLPYSIDQDVQGALTLRTNKPVTQSELLNTLEVALFGAGYALIYQDEQFRISTLDRARQSVVLVEPDVPGFGTEALYLQHTTPSSISGILSQYARQGAEISTDDQHRLILVTGPRPVRRAIADLVANFDADGLADKSFGIFHLASTEPATLVDELSAIFGKADPGSARADLQFVSLERMRSILVIATRPELIDQVQQWIARLDQADRADERRLFVHYVDHGEATQIAAVLQQLFGKGSSPAAGIDKSTAPTDPVSPTSGPTLATPDIYNDITQTTIEQSPSADTGFGPAAESTSSQAEDVGQGDADTGKIRIIPDDKNNAIFVLASDEDYKLVKAALDHLDIGQLQVLIEATIAEVTLTDNLRYGVQWYFEHNDSSFRLSRVASGAVNAAFPGFGYLLAADSARVVIDALDTVTNVNVISAPEVMVLDNRVARLEVGDEVPIATQSAVSTLDPDAPIVNSISYRNTGVILTVQPRVNSSGFVTLTIEQEVSDVVATTTSGIDSPTFRNRRIKSSVTVKDGATIALGGLIRDGTTEGTTGIPILSTIPVIGALFGTTTDNTQRTELLVLLTPRVVRDPVEADQVTNQLKEKLQAVWQLNDSIQ